jgi:Na+/glutamate symporter
VKLPQLGYLSVFSGQEVGNHFLKGAKTMTIPIWVFAIVFGIIISAIMAIRTGREERKLEMEMIEREGEAYIARLQNEKEQREEQRAIDL